MSAQLCGHPLKGGSRCRHRVRDGADKCAAGHQLQAGPHKPTEGAESPPAPDVSLQDLMQFLLASDNPSENKGDADTADTEVSFDNASSDAASGRTPIDQYDAFVPLKGSHVVNKKQLNAADATHGGIMNQGVYKITLDQGGVAFQKFLRSENRQILEVLVSVVGEALGAPVGEVIKGPDNSIISAMLPGLTGADWADRVTQSESSAKRPRRARRPNGFQAWAEQRVEKSAPPHKRSAPNQQLPPGAGAASLDKLADRPQKRRLMVLDVLVSNGDRWSGNWMMDKRGDVWGFDHEMARFIRAAGSIRHLAGVLRDSTTLPWLRAVGPRLDAKRDIFRQHGAEKKFEAVKRNYEDLLAACERT